MMRSKFFQSQWTRILRVFKQIDAWSDEKLIGSPSPFEVAIKASQGKPFVFNDGLLKSLHFSDLAMQSAMWLDRPNDLVLGYTQCMMSFLLQQPAPREILMVGLGGGSLAKFCYANLPTTEIKVVEVNADVIALRKEFQVPNDDHRFRVIHQDAVAYLQSTRKTFDIIFLDGFDERGIVWSLTTENFYSACKRRLSNTGILVSNHWGDPEELADFFSKLAFVFGDESIAWGSRTGSQNYVSFAFANRECEFRNLNTDQIEILEEKYQLNLKDFLSSITFIESPNCNGNRNRNRTDNEIRESVYREFCVSAY